MPRHDSDSDEGESAPKSVKQEEGKAPVKRETLEIVGLDGDQALQADDKEHELRTGERGGPVLPLRVWSRGAACARARCLHPRWGR